MRLPSMIFAAMVTASPAIAATDVDVDQLLRLVAGEYSNKPLVDAATAAAKPGEQIPEWLRDVHHMYATEVAMPRLKGRAVYVEWRHDGPEGTISGQRVWTFNPSPDGVAMMFHTLKDSGKKILSGITAPDDKTQAITLDDLRPYPEPCMIYFHAEGEGFSGENRPGQCAFPRTGSPAETFKVDAVLRFRPELHSEATTIWIMKDSKDSGAPEVENWTYQRIGHRP